MSRPDPGAGLRAVILGCGSSPATPRIDGDWGACDPNNPKNRRSRCALLVERRSPSGITRVLVDTGPDLYQQMRSAEADWVDGVLYTHAHADHIHGIDDLRGFVLGRRQRVDIYADRITFDHLQRAFGYCFETPPGSSYPPILNGHLIEAGMPVTITGDGGPITAMPFSQIHGSIESLGFRFGGLAYSCDISDLPDQSLDALKDLDVWIVDALRYNPHPSHFSVAEAIEWSLRIAPRRTILTHMHIDLDYDILASELPEGIEPGYDGLAIAL